MKKFTDQEKHQLSEFFALTLSEMQEFRRNNTRLFFGYGAVIAATIGYIISSDKILCIKEKILFTIALVLFTTIYLYLSKVIYRYFLQAASVSFP